MVTPTAGAGERTWIHKVQQETPRGGLRTKEWGCPNRQTELRREKCQQGPAAGRRSGGQGLRHQVGFENRAPDSAANPEEQTQNPESDKDPDLFSGQSKRKDLRVSSKKDDQARN